MATMASPKAMAMPSTLTAVGPVPMPATTAVPHPKNTKANVPMNSATDFFMAASLANAPARDPDAGTLHEGAASRRAILFRVAQRGQSTVMQGGHSAATTETFALHKRAVLDRSPDCDRRMSPRAGYTCRSTIMRLISAIAFAGLRLLGQAFAQFMIVWQR